ncbi:MAG: histidine kinase [Desulfomonile tiedjei]|nr:histidine kinase [Desulfomonile tiedjei]
MTRWHPRLATVLFAVNLLIFLLPLGGIAVLRLYESELIRRTETELIGQGAFVASIYRSELLRRLTEGGSQSRGLAGLSAYGVAIPSERRRPDNPDEPWTPVEASLDLAKDQIHPPAPDASEPNLPPDPVAELAAERVTPVLLSASRVTLSGIRVTDYRGVVVASTRRDLGKSLAGQEEVSRALLGEHVSLLRRRLGEGPTPPIDSISRGSQVRVFVAVPVLEGNRVLGAVLLSRTPLDLSKALYRNRFYLLGGGAVVVFVVCIVTLLTTRLVTRPVSALIEQANLVSQGAKAAASVPLQNPGTYEVDRLSRALSQMSTTLERRADYIRTFASNVSHEFKTPLTSMRGAVELLRDHFAEMPADAREGFLNMLEQDTDRLTRLVRRLLDLARADVLQPSAERMVVAQVAKQVAERFSGEGLAVTCDVSPEVGAIAMAPEVFESILSSLVDNARQHGGHGVQVHISARAERHEERDCIEIDVRDSGRGISESDAARVFTPFFTTARQSGGTGLGLSIAQALTTAHHGSVTLEPSPAGALFRIVLPVAH